MIRPCSIAAMCYLSMVGLARAQCEPQWFPVVPPPSLGLVAPGPSATVRAVAVLSNGDILLGGDFLTAGDVIAARAVILHGSTWIPLGPGLGGPVHAAAVHPNGDIIVGGDFTVAGGLPANHVARWDGSSWSPMGTGVDGRVSAIAVTPAGEVFIGGAFDHAGSVETIKIARWDGSAWTDVGGGADSQPVMALLSMPDNSVIVGGGFHYLAHSAIYTNKIARWSGAAWSVFDRGLGPVVNALTLAPNGDLIGAGSFGSILSSTATPAHGVARWNGTNWSALGGGVAPEVLAVLALPNGDVIVGGSFIGVDLASSGSPTVPAQHIVRWNGSAWSGVGTGTNGNVLGLALLNPLGDFIAVGSFTKAGGQTAPRLARNILPRGGTAPVITSQPVSPPGCLRGVQLSFSLGVTSSASSPLTYQWRRNGLDIDDVPGSVAGVHTPELTVLAASANTGVYDVVAATPEGCVTSATTTLSACPADFDCSGTLTVQDIIEFLSAWFAGDARADFDGYGGLTISDVRSFIYAWFRGC